MASYPTAVKSFTVRQDGPGNTIAAAHMNDVQDEVAAIETQLLTGATSFTPGWAASGSTPDIGNGTRVGSWAKVGKNVVLFRMVITMGSTTTFGSGTYTFTTPSTMAYGSGLVAWASIRDASASGQRRLAHAEISSTTTFTLFIDEATSAVAHDSPFTFAESDVIQVTGVYIEA